MIANPSGLISDLEGQEDDYLVLRKPEYWEHNFLQTEQVDFLEDCLPLFNNQMKSFLDKAYAYVYTGGPEINQEDIPAFSLDTGRSVVDPDNIGLTPLLWEAA